MTDPPIRIVSEQSEEVIARRKAREAIAYPLRVMAANIIRIVRGAGEPRYLINQMGDVARAFEEYRLAHGHLPLGPDVQEALSFKDEWRSAHPWMEAGRGDDLDYELEGADYQIVRGALQMVAAMLIDQTQLHLTKGQDAVHQGADRRSEARQRYREQRKRPAPPRAEAVGNSTAPKPKPEKHVLRYSDGTPVIVGRKKKKPPVGDPGDTQL